MQIRLRIPLFIFFCGFLITCVTPSWSWCETHHERFDVVVVGATPGGIMAAVAAARSDCRVLLLDRNRHIGGLPANGLGATDIATRGATGGLFLEFVNRIHKYYIDTYGPDSAQVKACSQGYHFEPHIAEMIFEQFLQEHRDKIEVRKQRQFDALPSNVLKNGQTITGITVTNLDTNQEEHIQGRVFIDATYEGDLAAAAGADYLTGREPQSKFNEPMAGRLYKRWREPEIGEGSTGLGDNAVQAYNYRLCLTKNPENQVPIPKPKHYNRDEFVSLIDDVKQDRATGIHHGEMAYEGIGRITNMARLPNEKTDANNQHLAFLSTDLPEENWPWPTSGWDWRDAYAERLKEYTLGLIWFAQHDSELPETFRNECLKWGLAKDEYTDNHNFPRQVYVREGRRIVGEYLFTAHDALPQVKNGRPPLHADSITASHYSLDSHAVRKREPGRTHLDGFFSYGTKPYTVPYRVIVPKKVDGLLIPVPVSGTHIGFSTLRMEPCWMALGQAAGIAAGIAIQQDFPVHELEASIIQNVLLDHGAVLVYFKDVQPGAQHFKALQFFALRGFYPPAEWEAKLDKIISDDWTAKWLKWSGLESLQTYTPGQTTRGVFLDCLFEAVKELPQTRLATIKGEWQ